MRTGRAARSARRCGALATRPTLLLTPRDAATDRDGGLRATASAAILALVAGFGSRDCIAAELACAAQSMVVVVVVVLLQSTGAEALPSSCEPAAVLLLAALLGRMAASCRLMIAARLVAAEIAAEWHAMARADSSASSRAAVSRSCPSRSLDALRASIPLSLPARANCESSASS
eukprot:scaffold7474_cov63-Phaeocystis_antarctica.AAC.10